MWNKRTLFLSIRIRLLGSKPQLRLRLPLALYVPHQLILACDGLFCVLPGRLGHRLRSGSDAIHGFLLALLAAAPQDIAQIDCEEKDKRIQIAIKTVGWRKGGGQ